MKSESEDPEKRTGSHSGSSFLPPDRGAMCIGGGHRGRSFVTTKSASRGTLLSVGPKRRAAGAAEEEAGTRERKSERGEVERAGYNP